MNKTITYLIALLALMISSLGAMAQNTGSSPYLNSTHTYSSAKTSGMTGTTMAWAVDGGGTVVPAADALSADISWTTLGLHKVFVTETTAVPNSCSTTREFDVSVVVNSFNLTAADLNDNCGSGSGTVLDDTPAPPQTLRIFTVNMTGDVTESFIFDYSITSPISLATINSVTVKDSDGTMISTGVSANAVSVSAGKAPFTVLVLVDSRWDTEDDINLSISNAEDSFGTPENLLTDNDNGTIIYALPKTSPISSN